MIELLAPAGDIERLKIALLYGADAVYIGGQEYSLRANAKNFSLDDIKYVTNYTHSLNKKVYVAVNIVLHNEDLEGLQEYLIKLNEIGIDAIIASDITVVQLANEINAKYEIHLSTQASTLNYEAVNFWKQFNVKRIVMARESNKDNIKELKEKTGVDIECFIHGAMCTSFSGRCVLSNYLTNRDSNRGGCAQICRWIFDIDDNKEKFTIMPKDLNMISNIESMINIGVNSFKIEGRMRSIYYIATVVMMYRNIIDKILNKTITKSYQDYALNILNRCANRDSKEQFYNDLPGKNEQYFLDRDEPSNQDFLGIVLEDSNNSNLIKVEQRNYFKIGDEVEIFGPKKEEFSFKIKELYDENMNKIDVARHPKMVCYINCPKSVSKMDMLRIKVFDKNDFI